MAEKRAYNKKTNSTNLVGLDMGKVPPQALDIEEAVLGALMVEKDAVITVLDVIKPESFYKENHQKIFSAIVELSTKLEPIDLYTVTEELRKKEELDEVGGAVYLAQLTSRVGSAAHVEYHSKIIAQKYIQRELIRVSSDIQAKAFDDTVDVDDLLDYSEMELFKVAEGNIKRETAPISMLVNEALKNLEEAGKREDGLSGVPCGFSELDRMTSGWQPSDLVIVAARPSMGKTAFVLSMARNMAVDHDVSVAFFSLEMSSIQLVNRLIVSESGISHEKIRNGKLTPQEWTQLTVKIGDLQNSRILIDDTPALSIFELRAKCRRLKSQHDIGIIIIDYLQLMTGPTDTRGNREQEVSTISRSLKAIAKELNVPILALSQLNRSVETRGGNKRPQLSDLRESGAIEQDADMVLFIHRPEYYGFNEDEEGNSLIGLAEIIVAKHRNGAVGDIRLRFRKEQAKFSDLDDMEYAPYAAPAASQAVTFGSKMNEDPLPASANSDFDFLTGPISDDEIPY
ncbi:MAG: replicative DNA helicase [Tenuifilaceae bacterium]|jgi:replicative DNA helicase|uniref:replicative DNA helicase n=1 Tax=Perlabentimonas gracilis TaxID=2715279 RepID=UPI001409F0EB|nr:replicative DNA helicase [Perlabentimonas gracilis]MDX9770546.1 replicative DNA helicase [Tenuifilaceae bacterium]NHB67387.1 replicative DNA helicase [Perlabentimonas gracilis]